MPLRQMMNWMEGGQSPDVQKLGAPNITDKLTITSSVGLQMTLTNQPATNVGTSRLARPKADCSRYSMVLS